MLPYHIQKMNEIFKQRQAQNAMYSLRAFARQLSIETELIEPA